jgi:hypothetical protein
MKDNVLNFPCAKISKGKVWVGGRVFESIEAAYDSLNATERRRAADWHYRNADRLAPADPERSGGNAA